MDQDLARHVIRTSFRTTRELGNLLAMMKQHLNEQEYRNYSHGIATAIDAIQVALLNTTFASHPELKAEVENSINKYDCFL